MIERLKIKTWNEQQLRKLRLCSTWCYHTCIVYYAYRWEVAEKRRLPYWICQLWEWNDDKDMRARTPLAMWMKFRPKTLCRLPKLFSIKIPYCCSFLNCCCLDESTNNVLISHSIIVIIKFYEFRVLKCKDLLLFLVYVYEISLGFSVQQPIWRY